MEKILIETMKGLGATKRLIDFIDRNFLHYDVSTIKILETIQAAVLEYYQSDTVRLYNISRKRSVVYKRQILHWLGKKYTRGSFALIGDIYGLKDHATVMHSCRTVSNMIETDKEYRKEVLEVEMYVINKLNSTELWPRDSQTPKNGESLG